MAPTGVLNGNAVSEPWTTTRSKEEERAVAYIEDCIRKGSTCQTKISHNEDFIPYKYGPINVFDPALAYGLLSDISTVSHATKEKLSRFVEETKGLEITGFFLDDSILPADVDTTSVVLWASICSGAVNLQDKKDLCLAKAIAKCASLNTEACSSTLETYFHPKGKRSNKSKHDPGITANAMRIFLLLDMEYEARKQEPYLLDWLRNKFDVELRNYPAVVALFFVSNCFAVSKIPKYYLVNEVKSRLLQMLCSSTDCLEVAFRIITAYNVGLFNPLNMTAKEYTEISSKLSEEIQVLKESQNKDGSWAAKAIYRAPFHKMYFGSEVMTTCVALRALYLFRIATERNKALNFYSSDLQTILL